MLWFDVKIDIMILCYDLILQLTLMLTKKTKIFGNTP